MKSIRTKLLLVAVLGLLATVNSQAVGTVDADISQAILDASASFAAVFAAGLIITSGMIGWSFLKRIKRG